MLAITLLGVAACGADNPNEAGGGSVRTLGNDLRLHLRPTRPATTQENALPGSEAAEYDSGGH